MPVVFSISKALELIKYGKFTLLSLDGGIPAAEATDITQTPMPKDTEAVKATYEVMDNYYVITERYNWGGTSRPDSVYYEIWSHGIPGELGIRNLVEGLHSGYYCGSEITESNIDNRCTHIISGRDIEVKLWNMTDPAADVYYDFTVWYYQFHRDYYQDVMDILNRRDRLLTELGETLETLAEHFGAINAKQSRILSALHEMAGREAEEPEPVEKPGEPWWRETDPRRDKKNVKNRRR